MQDIIERVLNLFAGHPSLIQGFNIFLPTGYRIKCYREGDIIRVMVTSPSTQQHRSSAHPVGSGPHAPDFSFGRVGPDLGEGALSGARFSSPMVHSAFNSELDWITACILLTT